MINYVSCAGKVSNAKQPRLTELGVSQYSDSATKLLKERRKESEKRDCQARKANNAKCGLST